MTAIEDINPNVSASIARVSIRTLNPNAPPIAENVTIRPGEIEGTAIFESDDPHALMVTVCIAINNGGIEFVSGTDTAATLRRIER